MKFGFNKQGLLKSTTVAVILLLHPVAASALSNQNVALVRNLTARIDNSFSGNVQPNFQEKGNVSRLPLQDTKILAKGEEPPRTPGEGGSW